MSSSSKLSDSDFNNITKKKLKNSNIKIFSCDDSSLNLSTEIKTENIVDVTSEIRVDVLRLLTIIKKMETEKIETDNKLKELSNKTKELANKIKDFENKQCNNTFSSENNGTCLESVTENVCDLNEYEIKLDKFKTEINNKFIKMQQSWRDEFTNFKQNIIDISRIKYK